MPPPTPFYLRDRLAIAIALILPTFITLFYFVWMAKSAAFLYGPLKLLQFIFPVAWIWIAQRGKRGPWPRPNFTESITVGVLFGLAVFVLGLVLYFAVLKPSGFFAGSMDEIRAKVKDMGLKSVALFLGCSIFYCLVHSLLEEYYWRWFVFRECRNHLSFAWAIGISSVGFMAHHVLVLAEFFHWDSPYTYLFSLGVAVGGIAWAWMYEKYGTLLGPWISHLIVDALIFAVGYDLVFHLQQ